MIAMIAVMIGLALVGPEWLGAGLALTLVLLFAASIADPQLNLNDITLVFAMLTVFVMAVRSIISIYDRNSWLMMYVILATYLTDTGAYFCGYFFGKHKLIERISPKKTVEGAIGGWLCGRQERLSSPGRCCRSCRWAWPCLERRRWRLSDSWAIWRSA